MHMDSILTTNGHRSGGITRGTAIDFGPYESKYFWPPLKAFSCVLQLYGTSLQYTHLHWSDKTGNDYDSDWTLDILTEFEFCCTVVH